MGFNGLVLLVPCLAGLQPGTAERHITRIREKPLGTMNLSAAALLSEQGRSSPPSRLSQELFSLADACGLLALCSDVSDMVVITPDTAAVWLDFLSKEHGADVGKLFGKVRHVIKERFDKDALWEGLNVEQVSRLEDISRSVAGCSLVE